MSQDSVIPVANIAKSQNDLIERGFSRQPLWSFGEAHLLQDLSAKVK